MKKHIFSLFLLFAFNFAILGQTLSPNICYPYLGPKKDQRLVSLELSSDKLHRKDKFIRQILKYALSYEEFMNNSCAREGSYEFSNGEIEFRKTTLDGGPEEFLKTWLVSLENLNIYWYELYSGQREAKIWKGGKEWTQKFPTWGFKKRNSENGWEYIGCTGALNKASREQIKKCYKKMKID